jgi:hypothetical protein
VVHAGKSSNVVLGDSQTASTQPETTTKARAVIRRIGCVGVAGTSAIGLGDDATRDIRSRCTLGVDEAVLLDDVGSATTHAHVGHDFARNRGLIDANAGEASGQSFGREAFGASEPSGRLKSRLSAAMYFS